MGGCCGSKALEGKSLADVRRDGAAKLLPGTHRHAEANQTRVLTSLNDDDSDAIAIEASRGSNHGSVTDSQAGLVTSAESDRFVVMPSVVAPEASGSFLQAGPEPSGSASSTALASRNVSSGSISRRTSEDRFAVLSEEDVDVSKVAEPEIHGRKSSANAAPRSESRHAATETVEVSAMDPQENEDDPSNSSAELQAQMDSLVESSSFGSSPTARSRPSRSGRRADGATTGRASLRASRRRR